MNLLKDHLELYWYLWVYILRGIEVNLLSADFTKWPDTFKQLVGKFPTYCLSVFDHFVRLLLKGLIYSLKSAYYLELNLEIMLIRNVKLTS